MRNSPLVSVLVPLYNKADWVEASLRSALDQTYRHLEVIVLDDGSTDGSAEVVAALAGEVQDRRLRLIRRENRGANATRNELLDQARGRFVQYLDADDLLAPTKVEGQVRELEAGASVAISPVWVGDRLDGRGAERQPSRSGPVTADTVMWEGIHTAGPLHRSETLRAIGGWTESLAASQEYDLHLRLFLAGAWKDARTGAEPLALWRTVPNSTSANPARVYQAKVDTLLAAASLAGERDRRPLARALANAARNLAAMGEMADARVAAARAAELDPGSLRELSRYLWWLRPRSLLVQTVAAVSTARRGRARS